MSNATLPISELKDFIKKAKELGCYSDHKERNALAAWSVVEAQLPKLGHNLEQMTVQEARDALDEVFRQYGNETSASAQSVKTYKTRARTLLNDFTKRHNGDFLKWKEELEKKPKRERKRRRKKAPRALTPASEEEPPNGKTKTHELRLPGGRVAQLVIPANLSTKDIDVLWTQIEPIKALMLAQAAIEAEAAEEEDGDEDENE
jgi:gas vesicle protein